MVRQVDVRVECAVLLYSGVLADTWAPEIALLASLRPVCSIFLTSASTFCLAALAANCAFFALERKAMLFSTNCESTDSVTFGFRYVVKVGAISSSARSAVPMYLLSVVCILTRSPDSPRSRKVTNGSWKGKRPSFFRLATKKACASSTGMPRMRLR